jgi:hypothetical protein
MSRLLVLILLLAGDAAAVAQGLSPKAGAMSEGLYTNVYFGMNYKIPAAWTVSFVADEGECPRECVLLDVRAPGEKSKRSLAISAERLAPGGNQVALAGTTLEQAGAKKVAPVKEIGAGGRKLYRADYRSYVVGGEVYHAIVMLPGEQYSVVFSFSAENRKQLDAMVDELSRAVSFVGASSGGHP